MNDTQVLQVQLILQGCALLIAGAQRGDMLDELATDLQALCDKYMERRKRELEVGER